MPQYQLGNSHYPDWAGGDEEYDVYTSNGQQISESNYKEAIEELLTKGTGIVFSMYDFEDSRFHHFQNYGMSWDDAMAILGGNQDSSRGSDLDEQVKQLGYYMLDLPEQGIELKLYCERHDFTQYVGSQSIECPMIYDLLTLSGNVPGIDSINSILYQDFEDCKAGMLDGFQNYMSRYDYDPPYEYCNMYRIIAEGDSADRNESGLMYYDGRYFCVLYDTRWCGGGASVEFNVHSMTFDLQTGAALSAADLFDDSSDFRDCLVWVTTTSLKSYASMDEYYEDVMNIVNSMDLRSQKYYLENDGELVLCYDKYTLGPGSMGEPEIKTGVHVGDDIDAFIRATKQQMVKERATIYCEGQDFRIADVLGNTSFEDYLKNSNAMKYSPKLAYILAGLSRSAYDRQALDKSLSSILYAPGEEPVRLRMRLNTLFEKLDSAYPDRKVSRLHQDHKKWGETVTEFYRLLGYPDGPTFLEAYGYTVEKNAGGRKPSVDPVAIMEELHRRYPDGSAQSMEMLKQDNPDIPWKTLSKNAKEYFGETLTRHMKAEGIIL